MAVTPGKDYTVQAGDSLWAIAVRAYGDGTQWQKIYQANLQTIGKNPDLIFPGQVLHIPAVPVTPPSPSPQYPLRVSTEIQGDILAGFNKDHRIYLFLYIPDLASGQAWLRGLLPFISNTKDVASFNEAFSLARHTAGGKDPANLKATWVNVSFTNDGLKLFLKDATVAALEALPQFTSFAADAVTIGNTNKDTGPSAPENWVVGREDQTIHALLNIQADDPNDLAAKVQELENLGAQYGVTVVYEQAGETLPGNLRGHEHFGYKDGISQPGIAGFDTADLNVTKFDPRADAATKEFGYVQGHPGTEIIRAGEFILGQPVEPDSGQKPFAPPNSALNWLNNGSFQVFRRLNQDVPGFDEQQQRVLDDQGVASDDPLRDIIGAHLVGRWKDGTPVDLSPEASTGLTGDDVVNNFNYLARDVKNIHVDDDKDGSRRCPVFAHIRKVYPRQDGTFVNRTRRIIRRGVPFGNPYDTTRGAGFDACAERGLLFVAYMSNINDKFEFLMRSWVNNPGFPFGVTITPGADPIIGNTIPAVPNTLPQPDGSQGVPIDFSRKVQTTGTLYAFVPSISALKGLASGTL